MLMTGITDLAPPISLQLLTFIAAVIGLLGYRYMGRVVEKGWWSWGKIKKLA